MTRGPMIGGTHKAKRSACKAVAFDSSNSNPNPILLLRQLSFASCPYPGSFIVFITVRSHSLHV